MASPLFQNKKCLIGQCQNSKGHERKNKMQKLFNKIMDKIGVPSLLIALTLLAITGSMLWAKNVIASYLVNQFVFK